MSKCEERIDRLQKRADHLRGRVAAAEADGRDLTFDKAELSALLWAIPILRASPSEASRPEIAAICELDGCAALREDSRNAHLEEAAKVCEGWDHEGAPNDGGPDTWDWHAKDYARAIRALKRSGRSEGSK